MTNKITDENHNDYKAAREIIETSTPGESDHIVNGYLIRFNHRLSLDNGKVIEYTFKLHNGAINIATFYPKSHEKHKNTPADIHYHVVTNEILKQLPEIINHHNALMKAKDKSRMATYPGINSNFKKEIEDTPKESNFVIKIKLMFNENIIPIYGPEIINDIKNCMVESIKRAFIEDCSGIDIIFVDDASSNILIEYIKEDKDIIVARILDTKDHIELGRILISHPDSQLHTPDISKFIVVLMSLIKRPFPISPSTTD